jgi:hypothetical protein
MKECSSNYQSRLEYSYSFLLLFAHELWDDMYLAEFSNIFAMPDKGENEAPSAPSIWACWVCRRSKARWCRKGFQFVICCREFLQLRAFEQNKVFKIRLLNCGM